MAYENERRAESVPAGRHPIEDRALKMAAQFFGKELLPLLGIRERVKRIAPTEQIHLEIKDFMEDFNFEMEDGTWRHLEFESDRITKEDFRRFRAYEAVCSLYYGVEVITCVVCTAKMKNGSLESRQGISDYRVLVFQMKEESADELIAFLEREQEGRSLERQELVQLLLTPLMDGMMRQPERIRRSLRLLQKQSEQLKKEDLLRMESILYAFAVKFLERTELGEIEEELRMTILGQMLEERGKEIGREIGEGIGKESAKIELICKKLKKNKSPEVIAEELEEEPAVIRRICQVAKQFAPEYDDKKVFEAWQKRKQEV